MTTVFDGGISAPAGPAGRSRRFKVIAGLIVVVPLAALGTGIGPPKFALAHIDKFRSG